MAAPTMPVRLERVRPQRSMGRRAGDRDPSAAVGAPTASGLDTAGPTLTELVAASSPWAERWRHLRAVWAQTTFFLFDADSWRR